ncbi:QueT transporter family protein [Lactobacillus sp. YT155]|uniref:QueT transporter family protein n=1 Tax=Lactobacillus sp. YT155 TaxID=3060955 RepID=UPI00265FB26D|nr:QueT transporter family protein [Lactobacillus sp. YT155]MDO1605492.1 QueT transporter family protein [Lactobacillus sp. YT155]
MKTKSLVQSAIVAALYIAVSLISIPFGLAYGPIQFRIGEMFNHFAIFDKKYILSLTIGCLIVNFFSPTGVIDMVFGTLGTLLMTSISYFVGRYIKSVKMKLVISTIICTVSMWTVALELHIVSKIPFWMTYLTVAIGELVTLIIGAIIIYLISKRIDIERMLK